MSAPVYGSCKNYRFNNCPSLLADGTSHLKEFYKAEKSCTPLNKGVNKRRVGLKFGSKQLSINYGSICLSRCISMDL